MTECEFPSCGSRKSRLGNDWRKYVPTFLSGLNLSRRLKELTKASEEIAIAVAWTSDWAGLRDVLMSGNIPKEKIRILTGVGGYMTDPDVLKLIDQHASLRIYGHATGQLYHPKLYLFSSSEARICLVGSANFTRRGFQENVELVLEVQDESGSGLKEFEHLWDSAQAKVLSEFELAEYTEKRRDFLKSIPAPAAAVLFRETDPDEVKRGDVLKGGWKSYVEELQRLDPSAGSELDLGNWLSVLNRRDSFIKRDWARDLNQEDLSLMYGKGDYAPFGRLPAINQQKFLGSKGKANRLIVGKALTEVMAMKVFQEPMVQKVFENLTAINGCGSALATRLLLLARPDWFVVVNKKSFEGLTKRFGMPVPQTVTAKLYAELLGKVQAQPWWKSLEPEIESERTLWKYRAALIDPLVYNEAAGAFDD
jgi:HKD family nuclease